MGQRGLFVRVRARLGPGLGRVLAERIEIGIDRSERVCRDGTAQIRTQHGVVAILVAERWGCLDERHDGLLTRCAAVQSLASRERFSRARRERDSSAAASILVSNATRIGREDSQSYEVRLAMRTSQPSASTTIRASATSTAAGQRGGAPLQSSLMPCEK